MKDETSALKERIEQLAEELSQLKEARDSLNIEARKEAERRDRANKHFKESVNNITELKTQRNAVNERTNALRTSLQENKERLREKKVHFQNLNRRLEDFVASGSYMSRKELEDRIAKIDWRIQTTTLPLAEENLLIDQVRSLESQLLIHKQIGNLKDEMRSLRDEMHVAYKEISELSEQRKKLRENIADFSKRASELKSEADKMHQKYLTYKDEAQKAHLKYLEALNQIKALQQELTKIEEGERTRLELELETDLEKRALEKLRERKKLTFDEFKILAEKGRI